MDPKSQPQPVRPHQPQGVAGQSRGRTAATEGHAMAGAGHSMGPVAGHGVEWDIMSGGTPGLHPQPRPVP